jgi:hypothetical protein
MRINFTSKPERSGPLGKDLEAEETIMLKLTLNRAWTGFI